MNFQIIATGSSGNCYTLTDGQTSVLIDPGIPVHRIMKATGFSICMNNCCLVTHEHIDHVRGIEGVADLIPVVSSPGTIEAISEKYKLAISYTLKPMVRQRFGSLLITAFPVKHNAREPVGYNIKSLYTMDEFVFITDSQYTGYRFPEANIMAIECNYSEDILTENEQNGTIESFLAKRIRRYHLSLETLINILPHSKSLKTLYLLHGSRHNLDIDEAMNKIKAVFAGDVITKDIQMEEI